MSKPRMPKTLRITMPDGSKWDVPVDVIAKHRAKHYAHEHDGDIERSLAEDTGPIFADDDYEIEDWAANNMNWSDVRAHAAMACEPKPMDDDDFREGWINGEKEVIT